MQTENKNSVVRVLCTFLLFAHISMGTLQTCGDQNNVHCNTINPQRFNEMILRHKRSTFTDAGYGSRLQAGSNVATSSDALRSIYGKFGPGKRSINFFEQIQKERLKELERLQRLLAVYDDRLQKGGDIAHSNNRDDLIDTTGLETRSVDLKNLNILYDDNNTIKDKRLITDCGYGSRLQAGRNVAKSWDRSGLFGIMGPGKRSNSVDGEKELAKRISIDLGYGSRSRAAANVAKSSNGGLFGTYGPGK